MLLPAKLVPPALCPPAPPRDYSFRLATTAEQLRRHEAEWADLARHAIEPNAFNEPWAFLPAFEAFAAPNVRVLLVFAPDGKMTGFFPLSCRRLHRLLPLCVLESWRHVYGFLCTPLVRAEHEEATLAMLFDWFRDSALGAPLWRLELASGDGPFARALSEACRARQRPTFVAEAYIRALMQKNPAGPDAYLESALSKKRVREVRRKERALAAKGKLEHRVLAADADAGPWADDFLALEASGWKGREGTAMASDPRHAAWFRDMVRGGHAQGRLQMLGLYLDGRAIALKCNYLCPPGAFAFKIAFDESFHAQSPGVVLEADNIARFHESPRLSWMDSCAMPGHSMIDRVWTERRLIQNVWVATGRKPGDLAVALMPLGRWLKRTLFSGPQAGSRRPVRPSEEP